MSRAYIAGVGRHLPNAVITFDQFHVIQLANAALEEVRRARSAEPADQTGRCRITCEEQHPKNRNGQKRILIFVPK